MGNRAVVEFTKDDKHSGTNVGVYLHWNGGRDSIEAFLEATKRVMADRGEDETYAPARFVQIVGNYLGDNLSLGLAQCRNLDCDNWDNGVYLVHPGSLEIIGRRYFKGQEQDTYNKEEMVADILAEMPESYEKNLQ